MFGSVIILCVMVFFQELIWTKGPKTFAKMPSTRYRYELRDWRSLSHQGDGQAGQGQGKLW